MKDKIHGILEILDDFKIFAISYLPLFFIILVLVAGVASEKILSENQRADGLIAYNQASDVSVYKMQVDDVDYLIFKGYRCLAVIPQENGR